ncbi:MAG: hypothetical protein SOT69_03850 [Mesosutterella sp.]|nr:hypothetical protein [Mesosutterella sp.]
MIAAFDIAFSGAQGVETTTTNQPLAQAIIGVDQLLTMGSRALYGYLVDPEIDVRRDLASAVYSVDLGFRKNFGMARRAQLAGVKEFIDPTEESVGLALGWLEGGQQMGLFQLLKATAGRKVSAVSLKEKSVCVYVGEDSFEVSYHTYKLFRHLGVRNAVEKIAGVFKDPNVSAVSIKDRKSGKVAFVMERSEAEFFIEPRPADVVLVDETVTRALMLPTSNFRDDQIWTFFDGEQTIRARMADKDFLRVIDNGIFRLNADDILVVKLHIKTVQTPAGLVSDYEVSKVLDHRKPGKHLPIPGV